jgi:DNA-binding LacI/PurR family transcriptional regulator
VAVSGFDDIPAAEFTHPPLTTVRQPIYEIGERLVELLVNLIQGASLEELQILLEPSLVVRDSSGKR